MAKYFEAININDSAVIIDDSFKNVELIGVYPLSSFTKNFSGLPSVDYSYPLENRESIIYGIGLSELRGERFCISIERLTWDNKIHIAFYRPENSKQDHITRDDIMRRGKLYAFEYRAREPTPHMTGVEIYNDQGRVVYTTNTRYLKVICCKGDTHTATVPIADHSIAFVLGHDHYLDLLEDHHGAFGIDVEWWPVFDVLNDRVIISKIARNTVYQSEDQPEPEAQRKYSASYAYGWLIGEVT